MKVIWITIIALLTFGCNNKKQEMTEMKMNAKENTNQDGMENMPGMEKNIGTTEDELKLSEQQIQLGNIQTDTIRSGMLGDKIVLTGILNIDQKKLLPLVPE